MKKERTINRWDRRRSNKRLRRFQETDKYRDAKSSLDSINIKLPELNEKQKGEIEKDLIKDK